MITMSEVFTFRSYRLAGISDSHATYSADLRLRDVAHQAPVPPVPAAPGPHAEALEIEINDRGRVQREDLADGKPADDGDAERLAQLRAFAGRDRKRQRTEQGCERGHHDGTEAQQAGPVNRVYRCEAFVPFGNEREVDHHDRILLDDSDEEDDADQRNQAELCAEVPDGGKRADASRWKGRKNRNRVNKALVENTENDVDGEDGREDEERLLR